MPRIRETAMTEQERALITDLVTRITAADAPAPPGINPWSAPPAAAPIDPEADALLAQLFAAHPTARYRLAQLAVAQAQALHAAEARIAALQAAPRPAAAGGGGFIGGIFGHRQAAPPAPAPVAPASAPYGGGFLGSALSTAAGVAGGMMLGNALTGLFAPHETLVLAEPSAPWGADPGYGTDPGLDPGLDPGADPGADPGSDPGSDPGGWDNSGGDTLV
jgi:hypothetical protein